MSDKILLLNGRVFDGVSDQVRRQDVLVIGNRIAAVGVADVGDADIRRVDLGGRLLMPGLIDGHVHICGTELPIINATSSHWSYLSAFAFRQMERRLMSGFTSLRDMGGANVGIARALREGLVTGPRLFYSGKLLSQTGGHGDARPRDNDIAVVLGNCCSGSDKFAWVVDGVSAVRRAVREELRLGAHQIKIMASGGILSPTDPLHSLQFSESEIRAAVEEATNHGTYVSAHCHPAGAIRRCAEYGVRVIEHATMLDEAAAEAMVANGTYAMPTLALLGVLMREGRQMGLDDANMEKLHLVVSRAHDSLRLLRRHNIPAGFGTDLFGKAHGNEGSEFTQRLPVDRPLDILRSATAVNADILKRSQDLGHVAPGALADLIIVEGDPLEDIAIMENPDNIALVMLDGVIVKDRGIAMPGEHLPRPKFWQASAGTGF
ncbi:amidohydrolase family protein [Niveispirillum sp.]|uniref:metal-dependent hydrolase family protein n=1 Tax=Niveispirillum sp. TaxID=1917217 RepID=UPI001B3FEB1C|nr:amidohydrolase family protein [Niveispirillum sp.]MBP7338918.1 amidohydrolase family protein [Niveispirillum sp.]